MSQMLVADLVYHPVRGINPDSNGLSARNNECMDCVNLDITSSEILPRPGTVPLTTEGTPPTDPVLKYHTYIHPSIGEQLFAFTSSDIYRFASNTGWTSCVNTTDFPTGFPSSYTRWSITNAVDRTIGATIVAAGSEYTDPTAPYTDGSGRSLLYYDPLANSGEGEFKKLVQTSNVPTDESLSPDLPGALADVVITDQLFKGTQGYKITPGTLYFVVDTIGVVAYAAEGRVSIEVSPGVYVNANRILPVDDYEIAYGPESYVDLDTGEFSIKFLKDTYINKPWFAFYDYEEESTFNPVCVLSYHNSIVMANTYETVGGAVHLPWRVRWTDIGDIFSAKQLDYTDLTIGDISPILEIRSLETTASSTIIGPIYFYKHNSIVRGSFNQNYKQNPDIPVPLLSFELAYSEGIEAINTLVPVDGNHIFLGRNDVYMFNGTQRISLTHDNENGNTRIQRTLFRQINVDEFSKAFAAYDDIRRKYMLWIPQYGDTGYPTLCYVYDLDFGSWVKYVTPECSAAMSLAIPASGVIDLLPGNIEDLLPGNLGVSIDDLTANTVRSMLFAMTNSSYYLSSSGIPDKFGTVDEVAISSYMITRDFYGQTLEETDRVERVYVEGKDGEITMSWDGDYSLLPADFKNPTTMTFGAKYRRENYNPDVIAIGIRFLLTWITKAEIRWMQVFSKKQELYDQ
jgi:hypothetical protein